LAVQANIRDKLIFREQLAQKISISKLNFIFRVLRHLYKGKASIANPDGFKDKVRQI